MRTQRIKAGFHRIGIVGAVLCGIPAIGFFAFTVFMLVTGQNESQMNDAGVSAAFGASWLVAAGAFYALSRALGWIVGGFAGDNDTSS